MSDVNRSERLLGDARERLETVPMLVDLVQHVNVDLVLRDADDERFNTLEYDAVPIVRALLCCELAGLSWKGFYEYLSTDARAIRLGFDPEEFGQYNTAPTHQTLTTAWDKELSVGAKRSILSVSERLVDAAYKHEEALDPRSLQHVEEHESSFVSVTLASIQIIRSSRRFNSLATRSWARLIRPTENRHIRRVDSMNSRG